MTEEEAILVGLHVNDKRRIALLRERLSIVTKRQADLHEKARKVFAELASIERESEKLQKDLRETEERYLFGYAHEKPLRAVA